MPVRLTPGLALGAILLALVCALHALTVLRTPAAWLPETIAVTLRPGEALLLGRQELGAPRAAPRQLQLRRAADGAWLLRNDEPAQPLVSRRGDTRQRSSDFPLAAGQTIQAGTARLRVVAAAHGHVTLQGQGQRWDYDGATLLRDGRMQPPCPESPLSARLVAHWNRWMPQALGFLNIERPVAVGGNLACGNRLPAAALEAGDVALHRLPDGAIALAARGARPVLVASDAGWVDAARRELSLAGSDGFAFGRTAFAIRTEGDTLLLRPSGQVTLWPAPQANLPPGVQWQWRERAAWSMPAPPPLAWLAAGTTLLCCLLAAAPLLRRGRNPAMASLARIGSGALLAACAMLVLATQRSVAAPGVGISLLLAWGALWLALLWPRRAALLPALGVLLLGAGLLVQLEMGLGALDSGWLRHFQNSAALLALALPAALLLAGGLARGSVARPLAERVLLAGALLALCGMLLQVLFGNETGVFDIQPFEFAKFALTALSAHCLALAAGGGSGRRDWRFWLRMAMPVLLFMALLALALVRVDDYSPLVLLLVWSGAMALAWVATGGRRAALAALVCAASLLLAGGAVIRTGGEALGGMGFYTERFQVWNALEAHPHTGQQMLLGAHAIGSGGWFGADGLLGLAALAAGNKPAAGQALAIPAVQDDFAPAFLLHHHGLAAGLALWTLQALFLLALVRVAARAWRQAAALGDFRRAWLGRFQCFFLAGGAAFVLGHLLLSWGTNLAMFPIMGQPMSFLSAGGSHLVFFICPLLAFGMASSQFQEESQSCRSMSNTKS